MTEGYYDQHGNVLEAPWPQESQQPSSQQQSYFGSSQAAWGNFPAEVFQLIESYDSGTDTDTESSLGDRHYDFSDIYHLDLAEQEQELFWTYQQAKGRWRQLSRKP